MSKTFSVTSQGSASARFQRAIKRGNLFQAELAAREMGQLPLGFAFDLCRLLAVEGDPRFERAVVRLHGRTVTERPVSTVAESQLLLAALATLALPGDSAPLQEVFRRFGIA